jgi:hypothetical protein
LQVSVIAPTDAVIIEGTAQGFGSPCLQVSVIAPTDAVIIEGTAQGFGSPCLQGEP